MFRSYLKTALRNLWKHKLFTFINIFGLASGMTVCLLAITHIKGAFDYDSFHPNKDRIYRILTDVVAKNGNQMPCATSPMPLAEALKRDYSFVDQSARVVRLYGQISSNHKRLDALSYGVDPSFFTMFGFQMAKGSPATEPNTTVLTQLMAEKFFGTANPIGQTLTIDGIGPMTVSGIVADIPAKSHLRFDMLVSLQTPVNAQQQQAFLDWRNYRTGYVYVLLKTGFVATALNNVLPAISSRVTKDLQFQSEKGYSLRAQALTDISPAFEELYYSTYEPQVGGLMAEFGVGLLTLLLAGFNYVNLTLARSLSRAREVGVRKVSGAVRWQLMGQFMAESMVLALLALCLAFVFLELVKPMAFVQQWLIGGVQWSAGLYFIFIGFSLLTGLVAGFVPARVLSAFEPAQVLRSHSGLKVIRGISLRKSLIVAQFAISLIAMISLLTMIRQQQYMVTADYGFRTKGVLNIPLNNVPYQRLTNELNQLAGVEQVSAISVMLGNFGDEGLMIRRQRHSGDSVATSLMSVDAGFVPAMNLTLKAGTNLPKSNADSSGHFVLINEEAVHTFKLGEARAAVGKTLWLNDSTEVQIAGVVADFRYTTFVWAIKPLVLQAQPARYQYLNVAVAEGAEASVLADAQKIWKRLNPYEPFAGRWYDDYLDERHSHKQDIDFMGLLVGLALSIACLGLLGMVTYNTQQRTKEVGIRKVMGADVGQLVWLLSWDFVKLLLIAGAVALPLGSLAGYAFLMSFAYHVGIGIETLGSCLGTLLLLGSLTIGIRTYRSALINPADSLRTE